jgi:ABC-2 type transport system permease protein
VFDRIIHIARKEFRQIFRDKMMRFLIFLPPIMEMLVFGYAASLDVNVIPMAILDEDKTTMSRQFIERFTSSGYFTVDRYVSSPDEIDPLLDHGTVSILIFIKKGFEGAVKSGGTPAEVLIVVDGTDSSNASVVMGYVNKIMNSFSEDIVAGRIVRAHGLNSSVPLSIGGATIVERTWYNEGLLSRNFFIPGIIGSILLVLGVMLSAMSIVKEREIGTMEQLIVTPIAPLELIVGKLLPFTLIAYFDVGLVTAIATLWFGVPFQGSLTFLFIAVTFFFFANLGVGLLISTVSDTQQQAMMNTFIYSFPAMLLSGFVFPIESMPKVLIPLTYANPMRYITELLRGIFLKGTGPVEHWPDLLGLFLIGVITLGTSAVRFRKRIA